MVLAFSFSLSSYAQIAIDESLPAEETIDASSDAPSATEENATDSETAERITIEAIPIPRPESVEERTEEREELTTPDAGTVESRVVSGETVIGNTSDLGNAQDLPTRRTQTRAASDYYTSYQGYVTSTTHYSYATCIVYPGEYLQAQVDLPNDASLDYDLILATEETNGSLLARDMSRNRTYLNGRNGTLSESAGWKNELGRSVLVYILVESYRGTSSSLPYTCHIGINTVYDSLEPDAIDNCWGFNVPTQGVSMSSRALYTKADADWYRITVPNAARSFNTQLDDRSLLAGYKVEVYTLVNGEARLFDGKIPYNENGITYYVRVFADLNEINGYNYTLTIDPVIPSNQPRLVDTLNVPYKTLPPYGADGPTYFGKVAWLSNGKLIIDLDYKTSSRTIMSLVFDDGSSADVWISNGDYFEVKLEWNQKSPYVKIGFSNDTSSGIPMGGKIYSLA